MAEKGANIDLLFRNGLKDYEVLPPPEVWDSIQPALSVRRRKRTIMAYRVAASFAALLMLASISAILITRFPSSTTASLMPAGEVLQPAGQPPAAITSVVIRSGEVSDQAVLSENTAYIDNEIQETTSFILPDPDLYRSFVTERPQSGSMARRTQQNVSAIEEARGSGSGRKRTEASLAASGTGELRISRWSVGAMVSPTYYSMVNVGSQDAASEIVKSEESSVSYTGGLSFAYKVSRRVSVQSGIYYSSVGQKINGIDSYAGFDSFHNSKGSGLFSVITSTGTIVTSNNNIYLTGGNTAGRVVTAYTADVFDPGKANLTYLNNSIHQNFSYLEIPFILKYKIFDRVVDLNLSGGISYNRLVGNSSFAYSGGDRFDIGQTIGLSPVTFSSSLGMGIEYSFSERLSLNLEPTFRYYMTPLGGLAGSSIHPYSFGVFSGIQYRF